MMPLAVLLVTLTTVLDAPGSSPGPRLSREAAALVTPILSEFFAAHREEFDSKGRYRGESPHHAVFAERLGKLLQNQSGAADEAIAALLAFYVGEGPSNELACHAQKRGRRMVPFLRRFRERAPVTGLEPIRPFFLDIPNSRKAVLASIEAGEDPGDCE